MALNDKDPNPVVGPLSPIQLQSHLKMEPKTLGVSRSTQSLGPDIIHNFLSVSDLKAGDILAFDYLYASWLPFVSCVCFVTWVRPQYENVQEG